MKTIKKLNSYLLFAVLLIVFTATSQISFAQEDTTVNSLGGFIKNMGQLLDTDGQAATDALYYANGGGATYYLMVDKIACVFTQALDSADEDSLWRMDLIINDAGEEPEIRENDQLYYNNYYLAHTGENGIDSVGVFESVDFDGLLDNIEINCSALNGLTLAFKIEGGDAGGSPDDIEFYFNGADSVIMTSNRDSIRIYCPLGVLVFDSIYAYQVINNHEVPVDVTFGLSDSNVSFDVGTYDDDYTLNIIAGAQPFKGPRTIQYWSTFFNSSGPDMNYDVTMDDSNNVYCTGQTQSNEFTFPILFGQFTSFSGFSDAFVFKFLPNRQIHWSSYFGGSYIDHGYRVAVNSDGYVYMLGLTHSTDLPVCTTCDADTAFLLRDTINGFSDIFIIKFNSLGQCGQQYSGTFRSYFGGSDYEIARSLTIDKDDNVYIGGMAEWNSYADFPTVYLSGAFNKPMSAADFYNEAFLMKIGQGANTPNDILWCTAIGGDYSTTTAYREIISDLTTDSDGNVFATGCSQAHGDTCTAPCTTYTSGFPLVNPDTAYMVNHHDTTWEHLDAFVMKFDTAGAIVWSTFYGGTGEENFQVTYGNAFNSGIAVDYMGKVWITGSTSSQNYTTQFFPHAVLPADSAYDQAANGGSIDSYVAMFNSAYQLKWSTFYGGASDERANEVAVASYTGDVYFAGTTHSYWDFPTKNITGSYVQPQYFAPDFDGYLLKFSNSGERVYATRYGGNEDDFVCSVATNADGSDVVFVGSSVSTANTFPFANPGGGAYFPPASYTNPVATDAFITNMKNICNPCLRIGEEPKIIVAAESKLLIYPNPANDYITIGENNLKKIKKVTIFNQMGAIVKSSGYVNQNIYIGNFTAGIYMIKLLDDVGNVQTARFIVK